MALSSSNVFEVQINGSDTNGGSFVVGTSVFTDLAATFATTAFPIVTSASYSFQSSDVGAYLYIPSGTNWNPGYYKIVSVTGGAATINATAKTWESYGSLTGPIPVQGCATVTSPASGSWTIDYSRLPTANWVLTNGTTNGTTTIATTSAAALMKGHLIYVVGGTGSIVAGWYQVVSVIVGTSVTVDRATGLTAGTGVTLNIGGAFATLGQAATLLTVNGMVCWIKYSSTPYTLTTSTVGAGGPGSIGAVSVIIEGYEQVRGDRTVNQPQWAFPATGMTLGAATPILKDSAFGTTHQKISNICFNGNSLANAIGIQTTELTGRVVETCTFLNFNGTAGIALNGTTGFGNQVLACSINGCTTGIVGMVSINTSITNCSGVAFSTATAIQCLVTNSTTGFSGNTLVYRCTADTCTTGFSSITSIDCLASNCTNGYSQTSVALESCYYYNCTTPLSGTTLINEYFVQLTSNPYVGAGKFALNAVQGGGASLRAAALGIPGQVNNCDVGALQHADPNLKLFRGRRGT